MLRTITICLLLCVALNQVGARPQTNEVTHIQEVFSPSVKETRCEGALELAKETLKYLQMFIVTIPNGLKYIGREIYSCARSENAGVLLCSRKAIDAAVTMIRGILNLFAYLASSFLGTVFQFIYCILGVDYAKVLTWVAPIAS